jgi:hypothetical protein
VADPDRTTAADLPRPKLSFLPNRLGVIELALFFAIALAIEQLWLAPTTFASLQPHPYWLPVIALSLQYGTADGLLAALMAILISLVTGWPTQGVEEDYYAYVIRTWAEPVGWILVAILVGEVRGRQRLSFAQLERDLADSQRKVTTIAAHSRLLEGKVCRLERRLSVSDGQTVDGALNALAGLQSGDAAAWQLSFEAAWQALLPGFEGRLYLRSGRLACLVARYAAPAEEGQNLRAMEAASGRSKLLSAVLDEERSLAYHQPGDGALLAAAGVYLAVPLRLDAASAPIGAVVVDGMPASEAPPEIEMRLGLFVRETAHALSHRGARDLIEASGERILLEPAIRGEPAPNMPVRLGEALQAVAAEAADGKEDEGERGPRRGGARGG